MAKKVVKIEYWNTTDVANIRFSNHPWDFNIPVYVWAEVMTPNYTLDQPGATEDEEGVPVLLNQKWAKLYRIETEVFEFQLDALMLLPLMDNIYITMPDMPRMKVKDVAVSNDWGVSGDYPCLAKLTIDFAFDIFVKDGCNQNFDAVKVHEQRISEHANMAWVQDNKSAPPDTFIQDNKCQIGDDGTYWVDTWLFFTGIPLNNDSLILASYLELTSKTALAGANCDVYVQVANDTGDPAYNAEVLTNITEYNAESWDAQLAVNGIAALGVGEIYQTPDITTVLTTLINIDSWQYGNNLSIRIKRKATCSNNAYREFYAYDAALTTQRPKLVILYV